MATLNLGRVKGDQGPQGPQGPAGNGFADAPQDGEKYVRLDGEWVTIGYTPPPPPPALNRLYDFSGAVLLEELSDVIPDYWAVGRGDGVSVTLSPTTTTIGNMAFAMSGITSVVIPDSVTSMGSMAFFGCNLASVVIGNGVITIPTEGFQANSNLTSVIFGSNITAIGTSAFNGLPLQSITLPESLEYISGPSFMGTSLTSITIPANVTYIGNLAFAYCSALATVNGLAMVAPTIDGSPFEGSPASEIHVPAGATGYGETFSGLTVIYNL